MLIVCLLIPYGGLWPILAKTDQEVECYKEMQLENLAEEVLLIKKNKPSASSRKAKLRKAIKALRSKSKKRSSKV